MVIAPVNVVSTSPLALRAATLTAGDHARPAVLFAGDVAKASVVAPGRAVMSKVPVCAELSPVADASSRYAVPARSTLSDENVATPPLAGAGRVPDRVAPAGAPRTGPRNAAAGVCAA